MAVGIIELISERIDGLDRTLPKKRLYRGFGALTAGGVTGAVAAPANPGGSAELEVSGPVDVVNTGGNAVGAVASAQQSGSIASVSAESVSADSFSSGSDSATGAVAMAQSSGPAEASVEVSGPVEASSAGDAAI